MEREKVVSDEIEKGMEASKKAYAEGILFIDQEIERRNENLND